MLKTSKFFLENKLKVPDIYEWSGGSFSSNAMKQTAKATLEWFKGNRKQLNVLDWPSQHL